MHTQHSVDLNVSTMAGGAEGAGWSEAAAGGGGAEGRSSSAGADGVAAATAPPSESLALNLSCISAYSLTHTSTFCRKYVL